MVYRCLKALHAHYPHIQCAVVLAYLPTSSLSTADPCDTMFPEELEGVPPKYAIDRRNRYLLSQASHVICFINKTWGGAYKFAKQAKKAGLTVNNLGSAEL